MSALAHIGGHSEHNGHVHHMSAGYQMCSMCKSHCHDGAWCACCCAEEVETLREQVQRAREVQSHEIRGYYGDPVVFVADLKRALDGGDA